MHGMLFGALLALSSTLFLYGCGGRSGLLTVPTAPSGTLSSTQASSFANSGGGGDSLAKYGNGYSPGVLSNGSFVPTSRDGSRADCDPTITGDTTDGDSDQIMKNVSATFNCTASGLVTQVSGKYTLTDADDAVAFPAAGLSLTVTDLIIKLGSRASIDTRTNLDYSFSVASGVYTSKIALATEVTAGSQAGTVKYFMNQTLTPDDTATPKTSGKTTFKGYYVVSASSVNVTVEASATDITYAESCTSTWFKDGVITFRDGGTNTVTFTYANCVLTRALNGTTVTR